MASSKVSNFRVFALHQFADKLLRELAAPGEQVFAGNGEAQRLAVAFHHVVQLLDNVHLSTLAATKSFNKLIG